MNQPQSPQSEESPLRRAVCPGSFDPVTNGHLDIIARASRLYDEVYVAVMINKSKQGLFSIEERIALIQEVAADYGNVRVEAFHGLLVDFCKQRDIPAIVKGLRAVSDFDYELQMAQMNNGLSGVETLFVPTNPTYSFLSSSLVKEVAQWGGDVAHLLPPSCWRPSRRSSRSSRVCDVDVQMKLDEIVAAVEAARSMPMSASCVVNRAELLAMLEDVRAALPDSLSQAQQLLGGREQMVEEARAEAYRSSNPRTPSAVR